jgi:hypothetical protein
VHQATEEGAGGQNHDFTQVTDLHGGVDTPENTRLDYQGGDLCLFEIQIGSPLANGFHRKLV